MTVLEVTVLGNDLQVWLVSLAAAFTAFVCLVLLKNKIQSLSRSDKPQKADVRELIEGFSQKTKFYFLLVLSIYAGSALLKLAPSVSAFLFRLTALSVLLQAGIWGGWAIEFWGNRAIARKKDADASIVPVIGVVKFLLKSGFGIILALIALDNLGVNITALMAGLGVGGIAVALAVQNILKDLFASLTIIMDKPFVVGDFIVVGGQKGTVENIGVKTTRLRSLTGEELTIPNADLLESRIHNHKRMLERRVECSVGVVYQTPLETLKRIPGMIREIIESVERTRFERAHFKEFGASSLNVEIVYWVLSPDYQDYMNIHEAINFSIYERFQREHIEFAYPTQTIYIDSGQLPVQ